ncbi:Sister chromatid cohesion protein DCC1 [Choanephora cucurbitarum]|uniref:Sister chromatid cohesion protein DCC1 n=1 Tax=Choanephora cucurbitarum TaxID=101091 RepID=A0A1C7MYT7_9FUNG|nr:Sister chromatid cohesion protein DCC1 [Choanephora cucurbitarum]
MSSSRLIYNHQFEKNAYSLIELSSSELVEAFESGDEIVIKGLPEDEAVLCTNRKTYSVRQVNTSNSMLIVTDDQLDITIHDDLSNTIELIPCLARTSRIDDLLAESSYSGSRNDAHIKSTKTLYTYQDLLSLVQASEGELIDALRMRGAFEHEGYYRLFDREFLFRLFDSLVTNAILHQSDFKHMSLGEAKSCIRDEIGAVDEEEIVPDHVLLASIRMFAQHDVSQDEQILEFDEAKICRFLGEWLLANPRNKRWEMNEFLEVWKKLTQEVFVPKIEYIQGLYVMHTSTKLHQVENFVQYFPVHELSTDPAQRFAALFAEKPLWSLEEITPFLTDLAPQKKDKEHLLLKFARPHRNQTTTLYGSRIK